MAKIATKELFNLYFDGMDETKIKKVRPQVDRPEVYAFEIKVGKQLVDMDVDDLFEMLLSFNDNRSKGNSNYSITYSSYDQIASTYRAVFNYYIEHIEIIKNPWYDKRMRGSAAAQRLAESKKPFCYNDLDEIIKKIHDEYDNHRAKYLECILLLFYNGFSEAKEIANLKEDMIDFKEQEVRLPGRTIFLSDRCFELLKFVHTLTDMEGWRGDYLVVSWNSGYFKYIIRPKEEKTFQDRPIEEAANMINRRILTDIKKKFGVEVNYRMIYLLGFYDAMVKNFGESRAKELILSVRNSFDADELMKFAKSYGFVIDNVSHLKRYLRPFI